MDLTDEQWRLIEPILPPPSPADRGRPPIDRRAVLNGILWKIRTDNPWYDMPPDYPSHQTCYRCHRKWARDGVMEKIYDTLFSDLRTRGRFDRRPSRTAPSVLTKLDPSGHSQSH